MRTGLWPTLGRTVSENMTRPCQFLGRAWRLTHAGMFLYSFSPHRSISTLSFLLTFTYAEVQETKNEFADVHATFEKFLNLLRIDLDALEAREKANSPTSSFNNNNYANTNGFDAPQAGTPTSTAPPFTVPGLSGAAGGSGTEGGSNSSSFNTQASDEKIPKSSELQERRTEFGLAYIMYMRFGRRAEGVKSSRRVFGLARKERWAPWEVYEAAGGC
jgi:cleavage stimulation factor subunit 3